MCDTPHINPCGIPQLNVGRDVHGRFTKANPGGPGNPFARRVAALRKALLDSVSEQDMVEMVEVLKQKARGGDVAAIKLILQYCVGKPEAPKDPDRMDVDEWQRLQQMRVSQGQFERTVEDVPACLACHVAQYHWPCNVQDGPLAQTVHDARSQLRDDDRPSAAPDEPSKDTPDAARPAAGQQGRPSTQGEPAGRTRRDGHRPSPQPPSPNGENGRGRRHTVEHPRRPRAAGQSPIEPPRS